MANKKEAKGRAFDPQAGEKAFKQLEPVLKSIPASQIVINNMDPPDAALAALALVDVAREKARQAKLRLLPGTLFSAKAVDDLEVAAWGLWYAHTRLRTESASATGVKVDAELYDASARHLARVLKLVEYHVGDLPEVAVELADIRSGTGYQDRAQDLLRAALLFEKHHSELARDRRLYNANDAKLARRYAEDILQAVRASLGKSVAEWADMRARAWSHMAYLYGEVRAAGEFVFRDEPEQRDLFVPLRQAVVARRGRNRGADEVTPEPETPVDDGALISN